MYRASPSVSVPCTDDLAYFTNISNKEKKFSGLTPTRGFLYQHLRHPINSQLRGNLRKVKTLDKHYKPFFLNVVLRYAKLECLQLSKCSAESIV